jgi:hypothetical protein
MKLYAKLMAIKGEYNNVMKKYKSILANILERISAVENKLKQFEDRENRLNNRESDSIISFVSKRASPSPDNGGHQKTAESKINAEYRKRKQPKRGKDRTRKLAPANPNLTIVCN